MLLSILSSLDFHQNPFLPLRITPSQKLFCFPLSTQSLNTEILWDFIPSCLFLCLHSFATQFSVSLALKYYLYSDNFKLCIFNPDSLSDLCVNCILNTHLDFSQTSHLNVQWSFIKSMDPACKQPRFLYFC